MDSVSSRLVTDLKGEKKLAIYNPIQGRVVVQTVREEDEYMKHLDTIVQRDYFPDLSVMQQDSATLPVLNAASERSTSSEWSKSDSRNPEQADPTATNLDKYLANNTTEDDASFSQLIEETERKRRIKLSSFFPAIEAASASLGSTEQQQKPLAITAGTSVLVGPRPTLTGTAAVHFNPDGVPQTHDEYLAHLANDRRIVPSNTRFKRPLASVTDRRSIAKQLVLHKLGHIGLDGKESSSTLSTPQAAGFKFMDASPSPAPSLFGSSPFMTWGELDATPSRLDDGTNTPIVVSGAPAFHIPSPSKREQLAHRLADRASRQRLRDRHEAVKRVQSGTSSPAAKMLLSPAARRLLASSSNLGNQWANAGSRPVTGSSVVGNSPLTKLGTPRRPTLDLGVIRPTSRHRPTSGKTPSACASPAVVAALKESMNATNRVSGQPEPKAADAESADSTQQQSITDNLLNLRSAQHSQADVVSS